MTSIVFLGAPVKCPWYPLYWIPFDHKLQHVAPKLTLIPIGN
jgi:hypothetical protein